jgi:hypothetical protein
MTAIIPQSPAPPDLAAIDAAFPGFHAWRSDAGHCYAAGSVSLFKGSGVTLDSASPAGLRAEIAKHLNAMRCRWSA